ncbi:DUF3592 domain-containing protein [Allokutzneria oryzae]|uniref:DUF3592 domain-containing protein n=1 Tax=Allokutzneria oryzae TaxID=1378989 RepID=A0ABV6A2Q2_9PSEU
MNPISSPPQRLLDIRAVRHGLATALLVLVVCAAIGAISLSAYTSARARMDTFSARAVGEVTAVHDYTVQVRWALPDGRQVTAPVELAVTAPEPGTRTEIAYDPTAPENAAIPGAALLAQADRGASGITFGAVVAVVVIGVTLGLVLVRARLRGREPRKLLVRRVRVQKGLLARSWLETESGPQRWIPVYFDPVLVRMPSPVEVTAYGDPRDDRLVAVEFDGTVLYPSGATARTEPAGRRTDNPATPGDDAAERARAAGTVLRQLRADGALIVPAPLVGLFWSYLDVGGFPVWLGATLITAALALWWAAIRGSDPS